MKMMEDKKQKILEAALELFTKHGFHGTPTSKISKKAGVATGTLFHYFPSKEKLIDSLYLHCKNSMSNGIASGITDDMFSDFKISVKKVWQNAIFWCLENPAEFNFFQQFAASYTISSETKENGQARFSFLHDLFENAQERNLVKDVDLELLMHLSSAIMMATANYLISSKSDVNKGIEEGFQLYWAAVSK